jgi:hypothetical protein
MGAVFLLLFQQVINHTGIIKNETTKAIKPFLWNKKVKVSKEKYIGKKDDKEKTGGRIDIFLEDESHNMICIENKIHAGDQEFQIKRYCSYKTVKNTVYYLTLSGEEPSEYSREELNSDENYILISYKEHIHDWLELCLKEVVNFTNLRETINQYILLIKKLTYTLNKEQQAELTKLMLDNFEGSKYISENYDRVLNQIRNNFRKQLIEKLQTSLDAKKYLVNEGASIQNKYSQIWISLIKQPEPEFQIGIESFSGRGNLNGNLFVGIYNPKNAIEIAELLDENKLSNVWRQSRFIKTESNNKVNLSNEYWMKVLADKNSSEYKRLIEKCEKDVISFIQEYEPKLFQIKK